jgi:hypothetical protein
MASEVSVPARPQTPIAVCGRDNATEETYSGCVTVDPSTVAWPDSRGRTKLSPIAPRAIHVRADRLRLRFAPHLFCGLVEA